MKQFNKQLASLVVKDGEYRIMLPTGQFLPCIQSTNVLDSIDNEFAELNVTLIVNLAGSVEYAKKMYDQDKEQMI
ncbi:hypothetical protein ACR79B_20780 [Sphingobacterium spiritivorum]|uniref:hypothetical protein n=1 Tax=Sphingobacterium spiritivorum TaxID=258 RepID=UPI003DA30C14